MDDRSNTKRKAQLVRHTAANAEARVLVAKHDGQAGRMVENSLEQSLSAGDVDAALRLDQVRREVEHVEREKALQEDRYGGSEQLI